MSKDEHGSGLEQNPAPHPGSPRLATRLLHHAYRAPAGFEAVQLPVYRASTVLFGSVAEMRARQWRDQSAYTYGLHGTPATFTLERRLAELEGARHAVLCPSGLAAIALVNQALLTQGDTVLIPHNAYAPGRETAERLLARFGVQTRIYDPADVQATAELMGPHVRLMWMEAPGSVTMEVPDLRALVELARSHGVLTALDNTWSAGIALKAFDLGVDVVMQALTKYPCGGADVLMGAVLTREASLHERLLDTHMHLGFGVGADDVGLVLRGLATLPLRYAAQDAAGRDIAHWLRAQPQVERVLHPALPGSPGHAWWRRDFTAAAGLFSFVLRPQFGPAHADAVVDALRLFGIGYSWGGPRSLAVPYHPRAWRPDWPHDGGLIRLSIGLEDPRDLLADLQQAFARALG